MKNIYKINIHPLFYITTLIFLLTGHFHDFVLFMIIILFHELGHIISGILLNWRIKQINILPFGAITIFDIGLTKSLIEEFIVGISGVLFQIIIYNLLKDKYDVWSMHYSILFFNLLPIVPLDGSKILNVLLNIVFPFKKSLFLTIFISILGIIIISLLVFINHFNFIFLLVVLFLIVKIVDEYKNKDFVFNKFLYERYSFPKKYKQIKVIDGIKVDYIYKERSHIFKEKNKCYTEREILAKRFDFKGKL